MNLLELLLLGLLQLLLEEEYNFLNVATGDHVENNSNGLSAYIQVRAESASINCRLLLIESITC